MCIFISTVPTRAFGQNQLCACLTFTPDIDLNFDYFFSLYSSFPYLISHNLMTGTSLMNFLISLSLVLLRQENVKEV